MPQQILRHGGARDEDDNKFQALSNIWPSLRQLTKEQLGMRSKATLILIVSRCGAEQWGHCSKFERHHHVDGWVGGNVMFTYASAYEHINYITWTKRGCLMTPITTSMRSPRQQQRDSASHMSLWWATNHPTITSGRGGGVSVDDAVGVARRLPPFWRQESCLDTVMVSPPQLKYT